MIEKLVEYLNQFRQISEADRALISRNVETVSFKQGDTFIEAGKVADQIAFVVSGVMRFFFYDQKGEEITAHFMKENDFATSHTSFIENSRSTGTIQAETDCELILISKKAWELFLEEIPEWSNLIGEITNQKLLKKTNFQRKIINQDAKTSYLNFVEEYPTIIQRVPLIHIASFLGVTKYSLSRIRKQILAR